MVGEASPLLSAFKFRQLWKLRFFIYLTCIGVLSTCMSASHACLVPEEARRRVCLELQMIVSCSVGAGKDSRCP